MRTALPAVVALCLACGTPEPPPLPDAGPTCERQSIVYQDADGDGFGAITAAAQNYCFPAGSTSLDPPQGLSLYRTDCNDADVRISPGQSAWQTVAAPGGQWDFNCDGVVELQIAAGNARCGLQVGFCMAQGTGNWTGTPPTCGVTAPTLAGCLSAGCVAVTQNKTQGCR